MQRSGGGTDAASSTSLIECPQRGAAHLLLRLGFGFCHGLSDRRLPLQVLVLVSGRCLSPRNLLVFRILGVQRLVDAGAPGRRSSRGSLSSSDGGAVDVGDGQTAGCCSAGGAPQVARRLLRTFTQRRSTSAGPGDGHNPPHALVLGVGEGADRFAFVGDGGGDWGYGFHSSGSSFRGREVFGGRFGSCPFCLSISGRSCFCIFIGCVTGSRLASAPVICCLFWDGLHTCPLTGGALCFFPLIGSSFLGGICGESRRFIG